MHIPDGYLSPETCAAFGAGMLPVFATAGRRVRKTVKTRFVPLIALAAAYSFLVMMLNVPVPDGTTAHAIGAVLIAVILGPDAAVVAVGTALAIQALFFGDGGVLSYGANAFNMAFVMPVVGYYLVYKPLARNVSLTSPRRAFAAALGGYVGINAAALCAAVEFGLQPALFKSAGGAPLYAPYHLAQTLPAMLGAHLTVAGGVEFALTLGVVRYLQRANLPVLRINHTGTAETDADAGAFADFPAPHRLRAWWHAAAAVGLLVLLAPLGLIAKGSAFGEADVRADPHGFLARNHLSAIPAGLARYAGFWHHALLRGYDFAHDKHPAAGYVISAFAGVVAIALALILLKAVASLFPPRRSVAARKKPAVVASASPAAVPTWLLEPEVGLCPCGCVGIRRKGSFVDKTLAGGAAVMRQAILGEEVAARPGVLQRLDPRVKLVSLTGLLVGAALVHNLAVLAGLYCLTVLVAVASHLKLTFFLKRVWLFVPIFTGIVVLPATLNVVTPGHQVLALGFWGLGVTEAGLHAAGLIIARVAVSISLVVLLTMTTPWTKLLAALRAARVPALFLQVMGMAYRYVLHLLGSLEDMYTARKSRAAEPEAARAGRAFVAATAGALFGKAHSLSDEVYLAMVSRGYTGATPGLARYRLAYADAVWAVGCAMTLAAVLGVDRVLGR